MRTKLSLYNSFSGIIFQTVNLLITFLSRTFFITYLGVQILGINGLFLNIMGILSVVELGLGSAITINLYKPIQEDNKAKISSIYKLYKKSFLFIGLFILLVSILISPIIPYGAKGSNLTASSISALFILFALNTSSSYFFSANRTIFFAYQRNYVVVLNDLVFLVIKNIAQIILLVNFKNYYLYLIIEIVFTWGNNLILNMKLKKSYKFLSDNYEKNLTRNEQSDIYKNVGYMSMLKIVGIGVNSTDGIILSTFIGVVVTGIYSNYLLIFNSIFNYVGIFFNGILASLGDLIAENSLLKIRESHKIIDFTCFIFASITTIPLLFISNLFVKTWLGTEFQLSLISVVLLCCIHYLKIMRQINWFFVSTSGKFEGYVGASVGELLVNITISIWGAINFGINGVLVGTLISAIISWIGQSIAVHRYILKKEMRDYVKKQGVYILLVLSQIFIVSFILNQFQNINYGVYLQILFYLLVTLLIPILSNLFIFRNNESMFFLKKKFFSILKGVNRNV